MSEKCAIANNARNNAVMKAFAAAYCQIKTRNRYVRGVRQAAAKEVGISDRIAKDWISHPIVVAEINKYYEEMIKRYHEKMTNHWDIMIE